MDKIKLKEKLLEFANEFIKESEIKLDSEINENTRLIGSSSIFDSIELVHFIVEVESLLEENFGIEIELTSEKAMSRKISPFISINTLFNYIVDESKE